MLELLLFGCSLCLLACVLAESGVCRLELIIASKDESAFAIISFIYIIHFENIWKNESRSSEECVRTALF